ncbi:DUF3833 family protein [Puniceibacterium sediminis]|uniref:DUF3833 domain-containing protein n=1 Tax=Puniceibacterium sediminis TaxID=1608407 RepID=A0A238WRC3_9RHOB|nr:DUF3833 family protein [Puniceibacterium sediminis]SNR48958.1 Protein of unknown function [Puniceibacterium sediminis]
MELLAYFLCGALLALCLCWLKMRYFGFTAQKPADYAHGSQTFDLRRHLNGPVLCEGVIYGPTGRVTSRFVGHFDVRWDGDVGVMAERFEYDSGDTQDREWHLRLGADGRIDATAEDVIGTGTGWQSGPSVQLRYRIRLPEDAGGHVLSATDWMYLAPNGTIINRSQFRKYGFKVAELVATMRRLEER